ncbi:type II toxin-antitoxin system HicA family toxin [Proteiniclasticum ruminis]|uniref:type II toxin-antitoxin system HicA family toxin n=1 Tax=Proteiniclasticum ruminis TaxID=398199 RepID=UPI0028AE1E2C|nr:type II toxin-antitoxin system HicA family toxin [Proteiniclasticum ruminis]
MKYREVEKILKANGWVLVRINGSHHQFKKADVNFLAVVPNHCSKDISIGVVRNLEKGTGLSFR